MLKLFRKHAKYFYFLFFIVILSFIFWGIGPLDDTGNGQVVAEVEGQKITAEEYWTTYDRIYRFYREMYKDQFDEEMEKKLNLKENVLDSLINERVLLIAAKEVGLSVSDEELQAAITADPAFKKEGRFDSEVYRNRLKLNRLTPEYFESLKRREILLDKMRRLVETSSDIGGFSAGISVEGDGEREKAMKQALLFDYREKTLKAYLEGLKRGMKIKVNQEALS
jgi:hypothetical protein